MNEETGEKIFILLDDVDGELDEIHRDNLYKARIFRENYLFATTIQFDGEIANHIKL
jgi:recombinational DNA repair ATPase RecF